jgi:hypothetical protein
MSPSKVRRSRKTDARLAIIGRGDAPAPRWPEIVLGILDGFSAEGAPLVDFPGNHSGAAIAALTTATYGAEAVGRQVALLFADGDPARPVIVGLVRPTADPPPSHNIASLDGERVVLKAKQEIVLECGRASITLTRAGKVLIRGAYLSSRSSGVHRIKGASVDIN